MKAAVLTEVGKPLEMQDVTISKPGPREVLLRTSAAGVCHSDLHFQNGSYPIRELPAVLGHESSAIVEQVGEDVKYVKPGDHVITCLSAFCGHCGHCTTGSPALCQSPEVGRDAAQESRLSQGDTVVGQFANLSSFAEQMLVHEHAIVKIREDMPLDRAALIGCGVLTGTGAVFHRAEIEPGSTVVVLGCGGVGLSCVNGASIAGAGRVIAVDMVEAKLKLAETFGATDTVNPKDGDPVEQVQSLLGGGADYTFEAIGLKVTAEQAFNMLAPGGTATIIGMIPVGTSIEIHGPLFLQERKIQGSLMGSHSFRVAMPRLIDFYLSGKLKLDDLIASRIKLEQINDAMNALNTGEHARDVIVFDH
ncbi:MAG: Zn-dependent alcohol dehydrogenase [Pseudomonadota bacterium]